MTNQPMHDPRILQHPEYARSYQHYLQQGAPPEKAAHQAYTWTADQFAIVGQPLGAPAKKKTNHVLIGLGIAAASIIALCGLGALGAAQDDGDTDTAAVKEPAASEPSTPAPTAEAPVRLASTPQATPTQQAKAVPPPVKPTPKKVTPPKPAAVPAKPKVPGIGSAVRDGQFEFVVKGQKCGVAKVGNEYLFKTAQGQYCLLTMTVRNIGDEPRTFSDSNQRGFNAAGATYSSDGVASLYSNEENQTFYTDINPGNQVTGTVVFDVPKGMKLARLELHDSPFSGGVDVRL